MRIFNSAAILLGLSAGLVAFSHAPANAQVCGFGAITAPTPCPGSLGALGGATFTIAFGDLPNNTNPPGTPPDGLLTYSNPMVDMYSVKAGFVPANITGQYQYTLQLDDPGQVFSRVAFTTNVQAGLEGVNFAKKVCSDGFGLGTCTTFSLSNTDTLPLTSIGFLSNKVYVTDTYATTNGTALVSDITNTFEAAVPGPLPVLGAGAAFGFSRKLRKRIKAAG